MATIAIVVDEPASPPKITEADISALLKPPISIGQLAPTGESVVASSREQLDIQFSQVKINVRDLSGKANFPQSRVPYLVHAFFGFYKTTLKSYGVNFIVTVEVPDVQAWLSENLLRQDLVAKMGSEIGSNRVHISFKKPPKEINLQFTRNTSGKLEVNFNASEVVAELPQEDVLRVQMAQQHELLENILSGLAL